MPNNARSSPLSWLRVHFPHFLIHRRWRTLLLPFEIFPLALYPVCEKVFSPVTGIVPHINDYFVNWYSVSDVLLYQWIEHIHIIVFVQQLFPLVPNEDSGHLWYFSHRYFRQRHTIFRQRSWHDWCIRTFSYLMPAYHLPHILPHSCLWPMPGCKAFSSFIVW